MALVVKNGTKGTTISHSAKVIRALGKVKGLMLSFRPRTLVMRFSSPRIVPLHMFFVFFPIDVLWAEGDGRVVEVLEGFLPFSTYTPSKKATIVIEMPAGTIKKSNTCVGDKLEL